VAGKIIKAVDRKRHTVYVPGYWRLIMAVVRAIPDGLFKRLKF
jgi:short-subunit dehydrogenase